MDDGIFRGGFEGIANEVDGLLGAADDLAVEELP
jgi:hypothetical protein